MPFDKEYEETGKSLFDKGYSFYELVPRFSKLNRLVSESVFDNMQKALLSSFEEGTVSSQMLEVAVKSKRNQPKEINHLKTNGKEKYMDIKLVVDNNTFIDQYYLRWHASIWR